MKHLKLLMLAIATFVIAGTTYAAIDRNISGAYETDLSNKVTDYRVGLNLPFYNGNARLNNIAEAYAKKMSENGFLSDVERDGTTPADRVLSGGFISLEVGEVVLNTRGYSSPQSAMDALIRGANELLTSTEFDTAGYGYYKDYRVMIVGIDDYLHRTQTMPICDFAIPENMFEYRIQHGRTGPNDCIPASMGNSPTLQMNQVAPITKTTVTKINTGSVITAQQQRLINRLNKTYAKLLNGKKLYIK